MQVRITTSGVIYAKGLTFTTEAEVKRYIEKRTPTSHGWTAKWGRVKRGNKVYLTFVRYDSKGRRTPQEWDIKATITMTPHVAGAAIAMMPHRSA